MTANVSWLAEVREKVSLIIQIMTELSDTKPTSSKPNARISANRCWQIGFF